MAHETILVVEDERDIAEMVAYNLRKNAYQVTVAHSGEDALQIIRHDTPDLVLLDLMLPGVDGMEVCRRIKQDARTRATAVIMLTAKSEEVDIVTGLELGADDYITKPFSPKVLIARTRAAIRRIHGVNDEIEDDVIRIHGIVLDVKRHRVTCDNREIHLTTTEFAILELLARNPGWVFTRDRIIGAVHGSEYHVTDRSVDVQVLGLRRKLDKYSRTIQTVRGVGYRMEENRSR